MAVERIDPTEASRSLAQEVDRIAREIGMTADRSASDGEGGVVLYFFGGTLESDGGYSRHVGVSVSGEDEDEVVIFASDRHVEWAKGHPFVVGMDQVGQALGSLKPFLEGDG